jgi:nickel-dependent lactate racemase
MRIGIAYGYEHLEVDVPGNNVIETRRQPPATPLPDMRAAVQSALETPFQFPSLRRALTPDDHVTVVVDEELPQLATLLTPILEHLASGHVSPEAITLLCPTHTAQSWVDELPDTFQEVHVEVHDPSNRRHLAYLATTRQGRRIYLNRTAVDADQLVVLTHQGYDPLLGYSGAEGALFPALSDEATLREMDARLSMAAPGVKPWPARQEAEEVAWLLGAPFFVQVIEGAADNLVHVLGGVVASAEEGRRLQDVQWRREVERLADVVVASVSGNPAHHDFAALARALACASRVLKPNGRIVLLTRGKPALGEGAELLRQAEDASRALSLLEKHHGLDRSAAFQWASAAQHARIYLLSDLPAETAEELFTVPLEHAGQVQRLLNAETSCLFLEDAHKALATVRHS